MSFVPSVSEQFNSHKTSLTNANNHMFLMDSIGPVHGREISANSYLERDFW